MEKQLEVSRSVKAKRKTPAAKLRYEMIKEAAMKFASQPKVIVPVVKRTVLTMAKKKKPKKIGIPLKSNRVARREEAAAALLITV